jgi:hypothetical protein
MTDQGKKPAGRRYRVMWDQNAGQELFYHPPMTAQRIAQAHFGFFEGRPVDAYVGAMGSNAGFTVGWPTKVENAEFIVDRMLSGKRVGDFKLWRHAENLRLAFEAGFEPEQIKVEEARRLGIDFWFRMAMNDWHHLGRDAEDANLWSGEFFADHPEYMIGDAGARGWPEHLWNVLRFFQDFAHEEVRVLRRDLTLEACERYAVDGFLFDFMRCPGYFKYGQEESGAALMTELMQQTRAGIDAIAARRGRPIRFAARVPNTVSGSERLGLDVKRWVRDGLVDILVPSSFFAQDTEEDVGEWVDLANGSGVQVYPALEEGHQAGHTRGFNRWFYKPPVMTPMSNEMLRGLAARHWSKGCDGIYVFNFFGVTATYDYDNREAVDDIGSELRLRHKDKTYVVARSGDSFPNCLETVRQLPAVLGSAPLRLAIEVADDAPAAKDRLSACRLQIHPLNMTIYDQIEVSLNGAVLECANPMLGGQYAVRDGAEVWLEYDLLEHLPVQGANEVSITVLQRNERLADEFQLSIEDVELEVRYAYPNGLW